MKPTTIQHRKAHIDALSADDPRWRKLVALIYAAHTERGTARPAKPRRSKPEPAGA
jgi:hypothetical protein